MQKFLVQKELDLNTDTQNSEESKKKTEQLEAAFREQKIKQLHVCASDEKETNLSDPRNDKELSKEKCEPGVCVDRLTSSWSMDPDKPVLSDISFSVSKVISPTGVL